MIKSEEDATAIVSTVYKRDSLSVVSAVYSDFLALMNARKEVNKSFKMFDAPFYVFLSKFKSSVNEICFLMPIVAPQLLSTSNVDNLLLVSILEACVSETLVLSTTDSETKYTVLFLNVVYNFIEYVVPQYDLTKADQSFWARTAIAYKNGSKQRGSDQKHWP